jgi:hypothetical protein
VTTPAPPPSPALSTPATRLNPGRTVDHCWRCKPFMPAAQGADRAARRLHLLRLHRGHGLCQPRTVAPADHARHPARPDASRCGQRPRRARKRGLRHAARQHPLDLDAIARLRDLPQIVFSDRVHAQEHSLEVHLPFLQRVLDDFKLVPLAVGHAAPQAVAEVLDRLWGGPETLIVISSDLSHFLNYSPPSKLTATLASTSCNSTPTSGPNRPAARFPVNGLLLAAQPARPDAATDPPVQFRRHGGRQKPCRRLRLFSLLVSQTMPELGPTLLTLARNAIAARLRSAAKQQVRSTCPNCTKMPPPSSR